MREMRVLVDQTLCATTGQCALTLPEVFRQREPDGVAEVCVAVVPPALHAAARLAASQCPVAAIQVIEAAAGPAQEVQSAIAAAQRAPGGDDGTV